MSDAGIGKSKKSSGAAHSACGRFACRRPEELAGPSPIERLDLLGREPGIAHHRIERGLPLRRVGRRGRRDVRGLAHRRRWDHRERSFAPCAVDVENRSRDVAHARTRDREVRPARGHIERKRRRRAVCAIEKVVIRRASDGETARIAGLVRRGIGSFAEAVGRLAYGHSARGYRALVTALLRHVHVAPCDRALVGRRRRRKHLGERRRRRDRHAYVRVCRRRSIGQVEVDHGLPNRSERCRSPDRTGQRARRRRRDVDEAPLVDLEARSRCRRAARGRARPSRLGRGRRERRSIRGRLLTARSREEDRRSSQRHVHQPTLRHARSGADRDREGNPQVDRAAPQEAKATTDI